MPRYFLHAITALLLVPPCIAALSPQACAWDDAPGTAGRLTASGVEVFDTGSHSSTPLAADDFSRTSAWKAVPEDETAHRFNGDAVLRNDGVAVVLRRGAAGAELYARGPQGYVLRAVLRPAVNGQTSVDAVTIAENTAAGAALEARCRAGDQTASLRFSLEPGQVFVTTEAVTEPRAIRVQAPCRFAVLPDFFADDIVVDAAEIAAADAELPSENFLMHMLPGGEAIVLAVTADRGHDARITLSGDGDGRRIDSSEIHCGKDGKVHVAALCAPGIWHRHEVAAGDAGAVLPLGWHAPYPAQWRVDWRRTDGLTGSWEMISQQSDGHFVRPGWFGSPTSIPEDRRRWTTVLGSFPYPCWLDRDAQGYLQPLKRKPVQFAGPAVIYPINRVAATPLDRFTVVDVVRATLGVGPCQYILDVEGQGSQYRGMATCHARDTLRGIYGAGQQKRKRAEVERALTEVLVFVKHIRSRIEDYVRFGHETLDYLKTQRRPHPELAGLIDELEKLAMRIDAHVEARREAIRTPAYVAALTDKFRAELMDAEGPAAVAECKEITQAIVVVGSNQDELVGECRMAVKVLRQRAGLALATDPRAAELANEIRRRTQQILRNPTNHEAARH